MPNYGVKISLPGFDVRTASPEQCAIHSSYDTFKVNSHADPPHFGIIKLTFKNNPPAGFTNIFSMKHGYNHRPSLITYFDAGPNFPTEGQLITGHVNMNAFDTAWIECVVTDTDLQINVRNTSIDFTTGVGTYPTVMTLRYYIFAENGKD